MANVKPGRAKDNARANVDVPKRKSAKGTATTEPTRATRHALSAAEVWRAMYSLCDRRELLALVHKSSACSAVQALSDQEREHWTDAQVRHAEALRQLDDAVLKASARVDGLVDLATNNVNAASSSWVPAQRAETLRLFDEACGAVDARIKTRKRAPMSDEGRAEAWRAVVALGLRLVTNFDQERTDASALREELERLCGNPPKSTEHGRAALIVQETIRAISKGDDKFVDKLRGKGKRDREDSLLERLEQWRRRLRKSGSSTLPRH